jgi:hypothetical protein
LCTSDAARENRGNRQQVGSHLCASHIGLWEELFVVVVVCARSQIQGFLHARKVFEALKDFYLKNRFYYTRAHRVN